MPISNVTDNQKAFELINTEQKINLLRKDRLRDELLTQKNLAASLHQAKTGITSPRDNSLALDVKDTLASSR